MLQDLKMKPAVMPRAELPYTLYLPPDYHSQPEKRWPLVIFLHGAGERGHDLTRIRVHGYAKRIAAGEDFPFILAAPQIDGLTYWGNYIESLNHFLDELLATLRIDPLHVCLTGLSMGGTGTWMWAIANPERFASIVPMGGTGVCWAAGNLNMPVWAFHGELDDVCPPDESVRMVERINQSGGNAKLTIYEGYGHDCWTDAYMRQDLLEFILSNRREQ